MGLLDNFDVSKIYGAGGPGDPLIALGMGLLSQRGVGRGLAQGFQNVSDAAEMARKRQDQELARTRQATLDKLAMDRETRQAANDAFMQKLQLGQFGLQQDAAKRAVANEAQTQQNWQANFAATRKEREAQLALERERAATSGQQWAQDYALRQAAGERASNESERNYGLSVERLGLEKAAKDQEAARLAQAADQWRKEYELKQNADKRAAEALTKPVQVDVARPDGTVQPTWVRPGETEGVAIGAPKVPQAEKPTAEQLKDQMYLRRAQAAQDLFANDPGMTTALQDRSARALAQVPAFGTWLAGQPYQKARQAQEQFIEAKLRPESGAAVSPAEYESNRQIFFPQPGEGPDVIEQKRLAREDFLRGLLGATSQTFQKQFGAEREQARLAREKAPAPSGAKPTSKISGIGWSLE